MTDKETELRDKFSDAGICERNAIVSMKEVDSNGSVSAVIIISDNEAVHEFTEKMVSIGFDKYANGVVEYPDGERTPLEDSQIEVPPGTYKLGGNPIWQKTETPDDTYSEDDMIDFAQFYGSRKSDYPNWGKRIKVFLEKWQEEKEIMDTPPNYSGEPSMPYKTTPDYMAASQAKEIAENAIPRIEEDAFAALILDIRKTAEEGNLSYLYHGLTDSHISRLRELGYMVESGFMDGSFCIFFAGEKPERDFYNPMFRISWGGENE